METTGLMKGAYQYALHWGSYKPTTHKTSNRKFPAPVGTSGTTTAWSGTTPATDSPSTARSWRPTTKCPGSKAPEFLLFTSESTIKSWNGERPKDGYGSKEKSTNKFEIDWVKVWERVPANKVIK